MGILKNFFKKLQSGFFYVVDGNKLVWFLNEELQFSLENHLEASANINIYLHGEKHHIQIWNYTASAVQSEKEKGIIIYYDEEEYSTIEELCKEKLDELPKYFKIELIDGNDVRLENYMKEHPELRVEDY